MPPLLSPSPVNAAPPPPPPPPAEPRRTASGALSRVAAWLGRGRRGRRRCARDESAAAAAADPNGGQASRQLAFEMLAEVRGMLAAYGAADSPADASVAGSLDGTTAAVYGSSATITGGVRVGGSGDGVQGEGSGASPLLPSPQSMRRPVYGDRSRTSAGSWGSASTASAVAMGGSSLTASAARAVRERHRRSMDLDVDGHVVQSPRRPSRFRSSSFSTSSSQAAAAAAARRTRHSGARSGSGRPAHSRLRNSTVSVRPLPPMDTPRGDAESESSEELVDTAAEERQQLLNSIVELLALGPHVRDGGAGEVAGGGEPRCVTTHLLRRFPTFPVQRGQAVAGAAFCPICLDPLSGVVMLLPCLCSGHESCMKTALSFDHRCPLHRLDIRTYVQEDDSETASMGVLG